jgi:transcriptional regulator with XRE-family HTH domain
MDNTLSRLRLLRVVRGLRLKDVTRGTWIWPSRVSRLERGLARPFKREAVALAAFFGVPVEEIFPDGTGHRED